MLKTGEKKGRTFVRPCKYKLYNLFTTRILLVNFS